MYGFYQGIWDAEYPYLVKSKSWWEQNQYLLTYYYSWRVLVIHTEYDLRLEEYIDFMTDAHGQQAAGNME